MFLSLFEKIYIPIIDCFRDMFEDDQHKYLVFELMKGGELFDKITRHSSLL